MIFGFVIISDVHLSSCSLTYPNSKTYQIGELVRENTQRLGCSSSSRLPRIHDWGSGRTSWRFRSFLLPAGIQSGEMTTFDLEEHFAFYGSYHSNPINIFIHMVFVWPILYTKLVIFHFLPFNVGLVLTTIYAFFYVKWDKKAGSIAALLCFLCWYGASALATRLGFSLAWKLVLAAQLFCWTAQFIGHGVFEKRAPALLDNLAQAFLMAPFFVLLEALQEFFGYEPYPGFNASVKAKVDVRIKEWKESKQKKIS